MTTLAIDRSLYTSSPRIGIGTGCTLVDQLIDAARDPEVGASDDILESAKELAKLLALTRATDDAATAAAATATAAGDVPLDQRADRTIKAMQLRLQARVLLEDGEPAERAADHLALLYPDGLSFTRGSFAAQDAVMQRMVRQLKDPELAASVDELAGPEYTKAFKKIARQYTPMVKAMGRVVATNVNQRDVLSKLQAGIVQHCSRVLGELRDADPKSVARTRALLAPIDNFRARTSTTPSRTTTEPTEATPATPTAASIEAELDA